MIADGELDLDEAVEIDGQGGEAWGFGLLTKGRQHFRVSFSLLFPKICYNWANHQ